jgi:hypothetical protein
MVEYPENIFFLPLKADIARRGTVTLGTTKMDDPSWTDKFVVRPGEPEYDFWRWVVENPARWSSLNQFSKEDLPGLRLEFEAHRSKVDREFQLLYSKPPLERNWRTRTGLSRVPKPDEKSRSLNLYDVIFYERDGEFDTILCCCCWEPSGGSSDCRARPR